MKREGRCADEVCCDTLDWYKEELKLPGEAGVAGLDPLNGNNAPCFPWCKFGWHGTDVTKRCCKNCNAPSAASSSGPAAPSSGPASGGTTKKTSGGGSNQNNPTSL